MIKIIDCYGVELTELQNMEFGIYKSNSNLPAMNTITKEERKEIVLNWLIKKTKVCQTQNQIYGVRAKGL